MTRLRIFRIVLLFWLIAWFINAPGEPGFLLNFRDALLHPIRYDEFPAVLTDPRVAFGAYLAPLVTVPLLVVKHPRAIRAGSLLLTTCSLLACLHLETGSDATFVTTFWVSLWLVWWARNLHRSDAENMRIARGLAHLVVGLIFLGAVSAKLTAEFHDGEAFFGLYFQHGHGFPYDSLRRATSPEGYRDLATYFSKAAISAELVLAASPVLPTQFVLGLYAVVMVVMMTARNYNLFSVLGAPLGLLIAAELIRRLEATSLPNRRRSGKRGRRPLKG